MNSTRSVKRTLVSLMLLAVLGTLAAGTYAVFTASTTTGNNTFASANLSLTNDKSASTPLSISNMVPADTVTGIVNVTQAGGEDIALYSLNTAVTTTVNVLTSDSINGLHLTITRCSTAWTGVGFGATCSGTSTVIANNQPLAPAGAGSTGSFNLISTGNAFCSTAAIAAERATRAVTCDSTIDAARVDHLKITATLPGSAGNSFQNLSTTVSFTFTGQNPTPANF